MEENKNREVKGRLLNMEELMRVKVREELMGELKEGSVETLNQLAESIKRGDSRLEELDEEGNLVVEVASKEGDIRKRKIRFGGVERDYLVGELRGKGIDVRKLKEVEEEK